MKHICHVPRDVVRLLGAFAIIGLLGIVLIIMAGREVPEGMLTLVSGAVGALGAILSSTRAVTDGDGPAEVSVVNPPSSPVPVTDPSDGP